MPMQTAHELFLHELSDMLDAERKILEALGEQAEESSRPDLQKVFETHRQQTEGQIERLETCFEELGEEAEETECAGMRGLIEEHSNMKEEDPAEDILDVFNVVAATKVERYEITGYESLIRMADMMGHTKVSRLLKQNLKEEQQTLKKMEMFANKVKPENLGMGEDEEEMEEDEETVTTNSRSKSRSSGSSRGGRGRSGRAA